jgi:hypothetical protein
MHDVNDIGNWCQSGDQVGTVRLEGKSTLNDAD